MSFSLVSTLKNQGNNWVWIFVNDKKLERTEYRVKASNLDPLSHGNYEYIVSSGGRTLFLNLNEGDRVYLKTGEVSDEVWHTNFCFHFVSTML